MDTGSGVRGEGEGEMNGESNTEAYTLQCVKRSHGDGGAQLSDRSSLCLPLGWPS